MHMCTSLSATRCRAHKRIVLEIQNPSSLNQACNIAIQLKVPCSAFRSTTTKPRTTMRLSHQFCFYSFSLVVHIHVDGTTYLTGCYTLQRGSWRTWWPSQFEQCDHVPSKHLKLQRKSSTAQNPAAQHARATTSTKLQQSCQETFCHQQN